MIAWEDLAAVEWERIGVIGTARLYFCKGFDGLLSVEFATMDAALLRDWSQVVSADFMEADGTQWKIDWPAE